MSDTTKINPLEHKNLIGHVLGKPKNYWAITCLGGLRDARQAAFVGLIHAANTYPGGDCPFTWKTHACNHIEWALFAEANSSNFVHILQVGPKKRARFTKETQEALEKGKDGIIYLARDQEKYHRLTPCESKPSGLDDEIDPRADLVERLLSEIPAQDAEAVRCRFGLDRPAMTNQAQAMAQGVSDATIHRRIDRGMARLKVIAKTRGLQPCPT